MNFCPNLHTHLFAPTSPNSTRIFRRHLIFKPFMLRCCHLCGAKDALFVYRGETNIQKLCMYNQRPLWQVLRTTMYIIDGNGTTSPPKNRQKNCYILTGFTIEGPRVWLDVQKNWSFIVVAFVVFSGV